MGKRGPAPKPTLQVVREGNPGHRPVKDGAKAPLIQTLEEPDWRDYFPTARKPARPKKPAGAGDPDVDILYELELMAWHRTVRNIDGVTRCRARARAEWRQVVPILVKSIGLAQLDRTTVIDYCVTVARLEQCEHRISVEGILVPGQKGTVRNPLAPVVQQYRAALKIYIGELGLSPSTRGSMAPPGDGDDGDDDPFD